MSSNWFEMFGYRVIGMAPALLVMLIGVLLALKYMRDYPRPCWLLLGSLGLSLFNNLGLPTVMYYVMDFYRSAFGGNSGNAFYQIGWTLPHSLLAAVSWGLLFAAIFDRPRRARFLDEEDPDCDVLDR